MNNMLVLGIELTGGNTCLFHSFEFVSRKPLGFLLLFFLHFLTGGKKTCVDSLLAMESIVFSCLSTENLLMVLGNLPSLPPYAQFSSTHTAGSPTGLLNNSQSTTSWLCTQRSVDLACPTPSSASFPRKLILLFLTQFRLLKWTLSGLPRAKWAALFCTFQHSSYTWILSLEEDPFNNVRVCLPSGYTENSWWLRTSLRECVPSPLMKTYLETPFFTEKIYKY